jgi:Domain of unknown function (DUF4116)
MSDNRPRLEKILALHGKALLDAVVQREPSELETKCATASKAHLSAQDLIRRFADMDPTFGKSRTQWMVKTYIKDEHFKLEDLGRADSALAAFERFKRKLPVEQRELSRLISFRALEALVDPFVKAEAKARLERDLSTATGREKRRLEELKARDESIIVLSDSTSSRGKGDGLPTIAVPMTEFAACWWGRGTKWCTAAEKNNMFSEYHKDAPLIVVVCPDGTKFQIHVKKTGIQFMDATDTQVNTNILRERWNELKTIIYWMLEQNGLALKYVPEDYKTPELCHLAVEQDGLALYDVPGKYQTHELCRLAVEQNALALQYVPEKHKTPELCRLAIQNDGIALQHVLEKHRIPELCRIAVEQNGMALYYVPEEYRTHELYQLAIEQNALTFRDISENQRTYELCCLTVKQDGSMLSFVPTKLKKPDLCRLAVEQNGQALYDVPKDLRTPELCRLAIEQNGWAIMDVPEKYQTPELCRLAVEQNVWVFYYVPEEHRDEELYRYSNLCIHQVIKQDGCALDYLPGHLRTPELCRLAVEQNGLALKHVPRHLKSSHCKDQQIPELCCVAVQQNPNALQYVPEELRTPELMAIIPPVQPKWHPDILQGLDQQSHNSFVKRPLLETDFKPPTGC